MTVGTTTNTGKTKKSVEKCVKKLSKPYKPYFFSANALYGPFNVFSEPMQLSIFRLCIKFQKEPKLRKNLSKSFLKKIMKTRASKS